MEWHTSDIVFAIYVLYVRTYIAFEHDVLCLSMFINLILRCKLHTIWLYVQTPSP